MRASLQTGGVPVELRFKPQRPRRPEIYVLCDVSTSVSSASFFFLAVLHALHDVFRRMRSFVFVERICGNNTARLMEARVPDLGALLPLLPLVQGGGQNERCFRRWLSHKVR